MPENGSDQGSGLAPLAGLRVLELARVLAGPWAGQVLADLGADVIKVESPDGDDTRGWGPPFMERAGGGSGSAAYYHSTNRGKRSLVADFTTREGQEAVRALAGEADVLIENFKVGGLLKYGLDYPALAAVNPRLVYCSVTGFGQTGPYAPRAGYDFIIQAMAGLMHMTGEADGGPMKAGVAVSDLFTGLYAVIAIQAALTERLRSGLGQHIDMALLDCQIAVMANQNMNYLATGRSPRRIGNAHVNIVPYQDFPAADGFVIIACGNDGQFARLCKAIGCAGLESDPRFSSNERRVRNREVLVPMLAEATSKLPRRELLDRLEAGVVPASPVNDLDDVFNDAHVIARALRVDLASSDVDGATVPGVRTPINYSRSPLALGTASPALGDAGKCGDVAQGWLPRP